MKNRNIHSYATNNVQDKHSEFSTDFIFFCLCRSKIKLNVHIMHLDLNDLSSVKKFAQEYISRGWCVNFIDNMI